MIKYSVEIRDEDWVAVYSTKWGMEFVEFKKLQKPILINWDKMMEALKLLEGAYRDEG